jgi:hypothetical protein
MGYKAVLLVFILFQHSFLFQFRFSEKENIKDDGKTLLCYI